MRRSNRISSKEQTKQSSSLDFRFQSKNNTMLTPRRSSCSQSSVNQKAQKNFDGFTNNPLLEESLTSFETAQIFRYAQIMNSNFQNINKSLAYTTQEMKNQHSNKLLEYLEKFEENMQSHQIDNILNAVNTQVPTLKKIVEDNYISQQVQKEIQNGLLKKISKKSEREKKKAIQIKSQTSVNTVSHISRTPQLKQVSKIGFRLDFILLPESQFAFKRYPVRKTRMFPLRYWDCERILYQKGEAIGYLKRLKNLQ